MGKMNDSWLVRKIPQFNKWESNLELLVRVEGGKKDMITIIDCNIFIAINGNLIKCVIMSYNPAFYAFICGI